MCASKAKKMQGKVQRKGKRVTKEKKKEKKKSKRHINTLAWTWRLWGRGLELVGHLVRAYLVPVDLGASDGQSATQRLERRLGHGLIVLRYGHLVLVLGLLYGVHDVARGALDVAAHHGHALFDLLLADELHIAVLVVVDLGLGHAAQLGAGAAACRRLERDGPACAPPRVPEVARLKLVRLDAAHERDEALIARAEHAARRVVVVHAHVRGALALQAEAPRLGERVDERGVRVRLELARLEVQVLELEGDLGARIVVAAVGQLVVLGDEARLARALHLALHELVLVVARVGAVQRLLEYAVVAEQASQVQKDLLEFARRRVEQKVRRYFDLLLLAYRVLVVHRRRRRLGRVYYDSSILYIF